MNNTHTQTPINLTPESDRMFRYICDWGFNWSGVPPCFDIIENEKDKGNMTDLKKKGLVDSFMDPDGEDYSWCHLTDLGESHANQLGVSFCKRT
tara:strand:- start:107 stop:388 length:282 start_codon:yes stop_codon:yes gene_type:complete